MDVPVRSTDPCFHWKEFRLIHTAEAMRAGEIGIAEPVLTDSQKVEICRRLLAGHKPEDDFAVWLDAGVLRVRYGVMGPPVRMSWNHAIALTGFFPPKPEFRKSLVVSARKGVA